VTRVARPRYRVFLGRCAQRDDACLGDGAILVNLAAADANRTDDLVLGVPGRSWRTRHGVIP
jgi:hypothetical protein